MSATLVRIATLATTAWTRIYTTGLADETGRARREQVASDLWEQAHDATDANAVAFSILSRLLRGLPDDLSWRLFVAPGFARRLLPLVLDGGAAPVVLPAVPLLAMASALAWLLTIVFIVEPVPHSLLIAGAALGLVAVAGWLFEARDPGGEASLSAWPAAVAVGIAAVALGAAFESSYAGLVLSAPMALGFSAIALGTASRAAVVGTSPVPSEVLQRHSLTGDAIAIERMPDHRISRRRLLQGSVWLGLGAVLATTGGVIVDFLWQRDVAGFGGIVSAGNVSKYPAGTKTKITAGKFWLVHLTAEEGGPGFLALWQKCPHLGCTVPWLPEFSFKVGETGATKRGWFRCPCHQSTYNDAGVRVFGPAPRSMDRMALTISAAGDIEVDTGAIQKGDVENAAYAVRAPEI
jgi:cytochrome b6-f complex iron-sulfur subunit